MRSTTTDEGTKEVLGWTFQCHTSPRGSGWISTDRSVWRALFTGAAAAAASLRRWRDLGRRAEEAERLVRETVQVPDLSADQAEAIAVTAHGEVQELLPFAPRGKVLGYTYRTEAGFGWVTACGGHALHAETSRVDAEQLVTTYTAPSWPFDRGDMTYGWIVENGRTGQLVNSRDDARAELAHAWATDRVAAST